MLDWPSQTCTSPPTKSSVCTSPPDILLVTARKLSLGQGNIFTPVCNSVHRGDLVRDGSASVHAGIPQPPLTRHTTPPNQAAPSPGTPSSSHPPWTRDTPGPGTPRPGTPREQAPPGAVHAGRHSQWAGGYASYWNAILLQLCPSCPLGSSKSANRLETTCIGVFPKWSRTFTAFGEFKESDKSLKHE